MPPEVELVWPTLESVRVTATAGARTRVSSDYMHMQTNRVRPHCHGTCAAVHCDGAATCEGDGIGDHGVRHGESAAEDEESASVLECVARVQPRATDRRRAIAEHLEESSAALIAAGAIGPAAHDVEVVASHGAVCSHSDGAAIAFRAAVEEAHTIEVDGTRHAERTAITTGPAPRERTAAHGDCAASAHINAATRESRQPINDVDVAQGERAAAGDGSNARQLLPIDGKGGGLTQPAPSARVARFDGSSYAVDRKGCAAQRNGRVGRNAHVSWSSRGGRRESGA